MRTSAWRDAVPQLLDIDVPALPVVDADGKLMGSSASASSSAPCFRAI